MIDDYELPDDETNVVAFNGPTTLDIPVERVLKEALKAGLTSVVILGDLEDGGEYYATSSGYGPSILWQLERGKATLFRLVDGELDD